MSKMVQERQLEMELDAWRIECNGVFLNTIIHTNNKNAQQEIKETYRVAIDSHTIEYLNNRKLELQSFYQRLRNE